jgi:thiamine kinase-like enzyme
MLSNIDHILAAYPFYKKEYTLSPIDIGNINETYRVDIRARSFLLQKINTTIFKNPIALMGNIELVANHLNQSDYEKGVLKPFFTKKQTTYHIDTHGQYWRVLPFFKNTYSINVATNLRQMEQAAKAFGDFINALNTIPAKKISYTIPQFHDGILRWKQFQEAIELDLKGRKRSINGLIQDIEKEQSIFQEVNHAILKGKLPTRITHNDTKINNLLFDKNTHQVAAIIDWDTIMPSTALSDFGDMMRTFASSEGEESIAFDTIEFSLDAFEKMSQGFASSSKKWIEESELMYLSKSGIWITYMQCIRFLTDYLNGDIYYSITSQLHNLDRARNQFFLLQDMLKKQSIISQIILSKFR